MLMQKRMKIDRLEELLSKKDATENKIVELENILEAKKQNPFYELEKDTEQFLNIKVELYELLSEGREIDKICKAYNIEYKTNLSEHNVFKMMDEFLENNKKNLYEIEFSMRHGGNNQIQIDSKKVENIKLDIVSEYIEPLNKNICDYFLIIEDMIKIRINKSDIIEYDKKIKLFNDSYTLEIKDIENSINLMMETDKSKVNKKEELLVEMNN